MAQYHGQNIGTDTAKIQTSPSSQVALFYQFITSPTSHLPVPLHQFLAITNLFFILTISIFQECHINEIIDMWTFVIDFFSLSIILWWYYSRLMNDWIGCSFFLLSTLPWCGCASLSCHRPTEGYLGHFQFWLLQIKLL